MRLWLMDNVLDVVEGLKNLIRVMVERADKEVEYIMPGYTHLQVSPILFPKVLSLIGDFCIARTTHPLVSPPAFPRLLLPSRSRALAAAHSPYIRSASRLWADGRQSLRGRP